MNQTKLLLATFFIVIGTFSVLAVLPVGANKQPSDYAIVLLKDKPLSSYQGDINGYRATIPSAGGKLDVHSADAVQYAGYLATQHAIARAEIAKAAPEVQILYEYSTVLNGFAVKLNGHNLDSLHNVGGIVSVSYSFFLHYDMNRSNALIGSATLWTADGGQSNAGAGMKIGIIDTGIDFTHPFLTDNSLVPPAGYPKCDALDSSVNQANTSCKYVSDKVIVAKMFCTQPVCVAFDAQAKQDHGSHVSGIAAGVANTCAPFVGCTMSGVAPKAFLGNYNVFPGNVTDASSIDIAAAVNAAVADGMDVLNLSLGGTPTTNDPLVTAVDNAVDAGVIVAIAAGNAGGAGAGTIESPGIADKVITVGASTDPHFVGVPVSVPSLGTFGAALGQFNSFAAVSNAVYTTTSPTNGCSSITNSISGQIALIARGACSFSTKIRNAQNAGASGVVVYNNVAGDPIAMGQDGTPNQPTIPAIMVSRTNGQAMATASTKTVSIGTSEQEFFTDGPSADILAGFSSRGPALIKNQILREVKPDVVAPGVNVYSSILMTSCAQSPCFAFFQGTSMATPHVAGSAALIKQLHPNWSPEQVKSALVNSAKRPVGSSSSNAPLTNPMSRGGGRISLAAVTQITATIDAKGFPEIGFGRFSASLDNGTQITPVTVTSVVGSSVTYSVAVAPAVDGSNAPSITASTTTITATGQGTAKFSIVLTVSPTTAPGDYFGDITLTGGTVPLAIPYWIEIVP